MSRKQTPEEKAVELDRMFEESKARAKARGPLNAVPVPSPSQTGNNPLIDPNQFPDYQDPRR